MTEAQIRNAPNLLHVQRERGVRIDDLYADDMGPDCPYCGTVEWPCGDHHHYGLKWANYSKGEPWTDRAGNVFDGLECPECGRRFKVFRDW